GSFRLRAGRAEGSGAGGGSSARLAAAAGAALAAGAGAVFGESHAVPSAATRDAARINPISRRMAGWYTADGAEGMRQSGKTEGRKLAHGHVPTHNCGATMPPTEEPKPLLRAARHLQHVRYEIRGPL